MTSTDTLQVELFAGPRDGERFGLADHDTPPALLLFTRPASVHYQRTDQQRADGTIVYTFAPDVPVGH